MFLGVAPMDGISDAIFRIITKEVFDQYGCSEDTLGLWTEFMNVHGYIINPNKVVRHIIHTDYESPLIVQLYGSDEDYLLKSFKEIEEKYGGGIAGMELNMGCPARKVVDSGCGVGMLREREKSLSIVKKLSEDLDLPFSIKTRAGLDDADIDENMKYLVDLSKYCSKITVHSRTFKDGYTGDPNWGFLYSLKNVVLEKGNADCKIIGNGGIKSYEDCISRIGNLDGVMIGQAAIGNPWVFTSHVPILDERKNVILRHLALLAKFEVYIRKNIYSFVGSIFPFPSLFELENIHLQNPNNYKEISFSVIEFRKFLFNYVKGIEGNKEFKIAIAQIKDYNTLVEKIEDFFRLSKCK